MQPMGVGGTYEVCLVGSIPRPSSVSAILPARCAGGLYGGETIGNAMQQLLSVKGNTLYLEGVSLASIAQTFDTPVFVFSAGYLRHRIAEFTTAFSSHWPTFQLMPSFKACPMIAIRQILTELGCGCDVFGHGELEGAVRGGVPPELISVNGSIKDQALLLRALRLGARIVIDSPREIHLTNRLAGELGITARVMLRLKPDMSALDDRSDFAPDYAIADLTDRIKYGIPSTELADIVNQWSSLKHIDCIGFHAHMGRHSKRPHVWREWVRATLSVVGSIEHILSPNESPVINIGGGFASQCDSDLDVAFRDDPTPELAEWAVVITEALHEGFADMKHAADQWTLEVEPGRALHSDAGLHLTSVCNLKQESGAASRQWAEVDTSEVFLDLSGVSGDSPMSYRAVSKASDEQLQVYDVVGMTCNAEMLLLDATMPALEEGDVIALLPTGAYIEPMAANFNALPRPGSVLVDGETAQLIKRHETIDDVFSRDIALAENPT